MTTIIPGLRSPYVRVGRLVYFGRMLDKIKLNAAGKLPPAWSANCGDKIAGMFDTRCCTFLRIGYEALKERTLAGKMTDEELLGWVEETGGKRTDEECEIWNAFMMKRGWRDPLLKRLRERVAESGLEDKPILTMFDYIDFDEGRDPVAGKAWEER